MFAVAGLFEKRRLTTKAKTNTKRPNFWAVYPNTMSNTLIMCFNNVAIRYVDESRDPSRVWTW